MPYNGLSGGSYEDRRTTNIFSVEQAIEKKELKNDRKAECSNSHQMLIPAQFPNKHAAGFKQNFGKNKKPAAGSMNGR